MWFWLGRICTSEGAIGGGGGGRSGPLLLVKLVALVRIGEGDKEIVGVSVAIVVGEVMTWPFFLLTFARLGLGDMRFGLSVASNEAATSGANSFVAADLRLTALFFLTGATLGFLVFSAFLLLNFAEKFVDDEDVEDTDQERTDEDVDDVDDEVLSLIMLVLVLLLLMWPLLDATEACRSVETTLAELPLGIS